MPIHTERLASPHRDLVIDYDDLNPANRRLLKDLVESFAWIVPTWCRNIAFRICALEGENIGDIEVREEYRQALIRLDPAWLTFSEDKQREVIAHELIHILLSPMASVGGRIFDAIGAEIEGPAGQYLSAEWQRAEECVTSDLERVLSVIRGQHVDARRVR